EARQLSLNRLVALKTILGEGEGAARWRRLRAEARLLAGLSHPNIVQIYDLGEHEGLVYIAMEFLPGGSLSGWNVGKSLPPRQAAELMAQVADALGFLHGRGVIHRDVKPANVLL